MPDNPKTEDLPGLPDSAAYIAVVEDMAKRANAPQPVALTSLGLPGLPSSVPAIFDPAINRVVSVKHLLDEYRTAPDRCRGTARTETLASFTELVNRHKNDDSVIFAVTSWPEPKLTAVIDYHAKDHAPRFGQHRVEYTFPLTDEFKGWAENDGKAMEQGDFAWFLEERAAELAAPLDAEKTEFERLFKERFATPQELVMLSRALEVNVGQKVKRQERLQTGERVVEFTTEHTDSKGEKVDIPGLFMISVPAFLDGDAVRIPCRLRYRIKGGDVVWFYQMYRWEYWLRQQVVYDMRDAAEATALPAYEGRAEA